jgi:hypothetical protein
MPVVWTDRCRLHDPGGEIFLGVRTPGTEVAERADAILAALVEADAHVVGAEEHPCYGGSCYLNNSAVAAAAVADRLQGAVPSSTSTRITATARKRSSTSAATCS